MSRSASGCRTGPSRRGGGGEVVGACTVAAKPFATNAKVRGFTSGCCGGRLVVQHQFSGNANYGGERVDVSPLGLNVKLTRSRSLRLAGAGPTAVTVYNPNPGPGSNPRWGWQVTLRLIFNPSSIELSSLLGHHRRHPRHSFMDLTLILS